MPGRPHWAYSLLLHWLEPISALGGLRLCHFLPQEYFSIVLPHPISAAPDAILITPKDQMVLTNLASCYLFLALLELFLLRASRARKVWRIFLAAMLPMDLMHLYALYVARSQLGVGGVGSRGWEWDLFSKEDWMTWAPSYGPLIARILFVLGLDGWVEDDEEATRKVGKTT